MLGLGKKEVEGLRLGGLFYSDFRELPAFRNVQISHESSAF